MKALTNIRSFLFLLSIYSSTASAQSISGIVNSYYQVQAVNTLPNSLTLNSVAGLSPGTKVLMIQMKGATIASGNSSTFGDLSSGGINNVGNYEFNYICSISGNDVILQYQILNSYTVSEPVQLVSVPVYSSVTVTGALTASPWDPLTGTGGVLAIEATNTITLNAPIDVSGLGFLGGVLVNYPLPYDCSWAVDVTDYFLSIPPSDKYHTGGKKGEGIADYILNKEYGMGKLANGGGGGNNTNTGGAGGGNYGNGGAGGSRSNEGFFFCHGTHPGVGGLSLSPYGYTIAKNRIFLGGGGGSGHENNGTSLPGGNGGGIVILTAALINGSAISVLANGSAPTNPANLDPLQAEGDGGGGGGAGGTIVINAPLVTGTITMQANGAAGSNASNNNVLDCMGPGGGGGAGVIWVAGASFPAAISGFVNGGTNGVISATCNVVACRGSSNGATPGTNGSKQTGYVAPIGPGIICLPLPLSDLQYFKGRVIEDGALLNWQMSQVSDIASYVVEYSVDQVSYSTVTTLNAGPEKDFQYKDLRSWDGTAYYRLKLFFRDGTSAYSAIVPLTKNIETAFQLLSLQPNPAKDKISLNLFAKKSSPTNMVLFNFYGQRLRTWKQEINAGFSTIYIQLANLSAGAYMLMIEGKDSQTVKPFIKGK